MFLHQEECLCFSSLLPIVNPDPLCYLVLERNNLWARTEPSVAVLKGICLHSPLGGNENEIV